MTQVDEKQNFTTAVNLFGIHGVTQAFLPLLARSRGVVARHGRRLAQ